MDLTTDGAFQIAQPLSTTINPVPGSPSANWIPKGRSMAEFANGISNSALASELLSGQTTSNTNKTWDARGVWSWHCIGAASYTHRDTPNTTVGDAMWYNPGQDIECVASYGMPCDQTQGTNYGGFHAAARSRHPGGVQVLFADGHANFIPNSISASVWTHLGSINDGQAIPNLY
jgi:prepilin-type processing-associated H-X9-DG protein